MAAMNDLHRQAAGATAALRSVLSTDVDQHAESLSAWQQRYEQLGRGQFRGRLDEVWLDDLQLFRERTNVAMLETGEPWADAWTLGVPLAMSQPAVHFGHTVDAESALVVDAASGMCLRTPAAFDVVGISIPAGLLQRFASGLEGEDAEPLVGQIPVVRIAPVILRDLKQRLLEAFGLLADEAVPLGSPSARASLRNELLESVMEALQHTTGLAADSGTLSAHRRLAEQAREMAHATPALPPSVLDLCERLGVSRRTLQTCFQQVLGTSPHRYLLNMRLNGLRRALRQAAATDTVQSLAADWGFWHLSSCAAEYRRLFGELPSATLRRAPDIRPAGG